MPAPPPSPEERRDAVLRRLDLVAASAALDLIIRCGLRTRIDNGILRSLAAALAIVDRGATEAGVMQQHEGAARVHIREMVNLLQDLRRYVPAPAASAPPPLPSKLAELHARDDVQLAALATQQGEPLHRVDECGVFRQVRPTGSSSLAATSKSARRRAPICRRWIVAACPSASARDARRSGPLAQSPSRGRLPRGQGAGRRSIATSGRRATWCGTTTCTSFRCRPSSTT
jgi:hypothetical protein